MTDIITNNPRTCIVVRNNIEMLVLSSLCFRDITVVSTDLHEGSRSRRFTSHIIHLIFNSPLSFNEVVDHCVAWEC